MMKTWEETCTNKRSRCRRDCVNKICASWFSSCMRRGNQVIVCHGLAITKLQARWDDSKYNENLGRSVHIIHEEVGTGGQCGM